MHCLFPGLSIQRLEYCSVAPAEARYPCGAGIPTRNLGLPALDSQLRSDSCSTNVKQLVSIIIIAILIIFCKIIVWVLGVVAGGWWWLLAVHTAAGG